MAEKPPQNPPKKMKVDFNEYGLQDKAVLPKGPTRKPAPSSKPNYDAINAAALRACPEILEQWLPSGKVRGNEFVCGDLMGNPGHSLSINLNKGLWKDFGTGDGGGDLISLYAAIHNLKQSEAAKALMNDLHLHGSVAEQGRQRKKPSPKQPDWRVVRPVPGDAPAPPDTHYRFGAASATWEYRDEQGRMLGRVCRFDLAEGGKQILPQAFMEHKSGTQEWRWKSLDHPRPLYGLDRLGNREIVLLTEGEKAADAAAQLLPPEIVAMTWSGGANSIGKADFSPLAGRHVILWPDNDPAGVQAMQGVAKVLESIGVKQVSTVTPPEGVAAKWDLADALADGWTKDHLAEYLDAFMAPAPPARRLHFLSLGEMLKEPKITTWLLKGYLEAETMSVLFGEPGSMKSFLAIDVGMCIATGTPWHGIDVKHPGPVFYIAGEGFRGLSARLKAWCAYHKVAEAAPFFVSSQSAQFLDDDSAAQVVCAIEEMVATHGVPRLIIVDTLSRCFGPGDENSTKDMTAFVNALDKTRLALGGCAMMVVHHSGLADKDRSRGSSVLLGALEFEYRLKKNDDGTRQLICKKAKDHEEPEDIYFQPKQMHIGWVDHDTGDEMTSCVLCKTIEPIHSCTRIARLSGDARIVYDVLAALTKETGSASKDAWRNQSYAAMEHKEKTNAKRQAFNRAIQFLSENSYAQCDSDGEWSISDRDIGVTYRDIEGIDQ